MSKRLLRSRSNRIDLLLLLVLLILIGCIIGLLNARLKPHQKGPDIPAVSDSQSPAGQPSGDPAGNTEPSGSAAPANTHWERKEGFYTILVSGLDDDNGGSDTNILVAVDTVGGHIYGASIPRDTKAIINGKAHKINYAYNQGGISGLAEVVSQQLGIPVDYTVLVNLKGFQALVDAIDGIDFNVPVNMNYDDPVQNLEIHFSKGMQHLNGAQALKVVRFRHNNDGSGYGSEDIGRMETQQKFLKAIAKKMLSLSSLDKLDDYAKIFNSYVDTDLTLGNLVWLGGQLIRIGSDNVDFSTLPNKWKSPYIHLVKDDLLELINTHLNPYVEDRVAADLHLPS